MRGTYLYVYYTSVAIETLQKTNGCGRTFKFLNLPAKLNDVDATYYVKETNAPSEYTVNYGWIKSEEKEVQGITVTERSYQNVTDVEAAGDGKVIRNMKTDEGVELPSTGGSGTSCIYFLGNILTLIAAGLLWQRKMKQL